MKTFILSILAVIFFSMYGSGSNTSEIIPVTQSQNTAPANTATTTMQRHDWPHNWWKDANYTITGIKDEAGNEMEIAYQEGAEGPYPFRFVISPDTWQSPSDKEGAFLRHRDTMLVIDDGCRFLRCKVSVIAGKPNFTFKSMVMIEPGWCNSKINERAFEVMKNVLCNFSTYEITDILTLTLKGKGKEQISFTTTGSKY